MTVDIPWKRENIELQIPDKNYAGTFLPNPVAEPLPAVELINEACGSGLEDFLNTDGPLLVIVNDGTRPTPTASVLNAIGGRLLEKDCRFIIATGVHRGPTEEEYRFIFGDLLERVRDRILVHDARDESSLEYVGTTGRGTAFTLNRAAIDASAILIIGGVEPHYFAGWAGGRKGLLPGISGYESIEQNHKLALSPEAYTLNLKGNPVHEDMLEAVAMLDKPLYTIMTVLDREHRLCAVTAGAMESAFDQAVKEAEKVYVTEVAEKADIVISAARYPMDVDLYQAQKALDNGALILKKGGTMLLAASCREGIGEEAFKNLLSGSRTTAEVMETIDRGYKLGYHKAAKMAQVLGDFNVKAKTDLGADLIRSIFMEPVADLQAELDRLIAESGGKAQVAVLPDGCVTVGKVQT